MANESVWRARFLELLQERAECFGEFTWMILNVSNQRGVPDVWVHLAEGKKRACALLEFKKGKGEVSKAQRIRMAGLREKGVLTRVVRLRNHQEARFEIWSGTDVGLMEPVVTWEQLAQDLITWLRNFPEN